MDQKPEGELIEVVMSPSKEELEEDAEVLRLKTLLYTPEEEKKVVRKFDLHILTFLCALYMLSYLDRGNIGNAKTAGMNKDLGMTDSQFQWLLTIFYISYIVFQWLTMLWKIFPPRFYVPCVVIAWGVISSCFAAANNWGGLMAMRFLLGVLEAGFGPGVPYYITFFDFRPEVAWRTGIFMAVSPLSSAFAGALAYGITKNELAIENWRVLFLVEGLPTIAVGIIGFYAIQNEGRTCRFLTPREQDIAAARTIKQTGTPERENKFELSEIVSSFADLKNWCCMLMFFSINVSFASLPVYMPTIIEEMGYSSVNAQGLSAPPYILTTIVVLLASWLSDKYQVRSLFICGITIIGSVGYLLLAFIDTVGVRYFACFLIAVGIFPAVPLLITWSGNCHSSDGKKGMGFVLLQVVGQCGPLLGTRIFPASDGPRYQKGCLISFGFLAFTCILALVLRFHLQRLNKKLDGEYGQVDPDVRAAVEVGQTKENFRFIL